MVFRCTLIDKQIKKTSYLQMNKGEIINGIVLKASLSNPRLPLWKMNVSPETAPRSPLQSAGQPGLSGHAIPQTHC